MDRGPSDITYIIALSIILIAVRATNVTNAYQLSLIVLLGVRCNMDKRLTAIRRPYSNTVHVITAVSYIKKFDNRHFYSV